jgi:hypothetical protein
MEFGKIFFTTVFCCCVLLLWVVVVGGGLWLVAMAGWRDGNAVIFCDLDELLVEILYFLKRTGVQCILNSKVSLKSTALCSYIIK